MSQQTGWDRKYMLALPWRWWQAWQSCPHSVQTCPNRQVETESTCWLYLGDNDRRDRVVLTVYKHVPTDRLRQKVHAGFTLEVMTDVTKMSSLVYRCVTARQVCEVKSLSDSIAAPCRWNRKTHLTLHTHKMKTFLCRKQTKSNHGNIKNNKNKMMFTWGKNKPSLSKHTQNSHPSLIYEISIPDPGSQCTITTPQPCQICA